VGVEIDFTHQPTGDEHERHSIHPEPVDAQLHPKAGDPLDLGPHPGVRDVEIGLVGEEVMEVVLTGFSVSSPNALLGFGEHERQVLVLDGLFSPDVIVSILGLRVAARLLKPRMLIRGVVDHEINDHSHPSLVCLAQHDHEVTKGPEPIVDSVIVGDVISVVAIRRRIEGHEPDASDSDLCR
jgi:hypothetical protein